MQKSWWCLTGVGLLLFGCSEHFPLVVYTPGFRPPHEQIWKFETTPQLPRNPLEELAVNAALSRRIVKSGAITAGYLGEYGDRRLVVAFEDIDSPAERFAKKKVNRFIVKGGGIQGYLGPSIEPLPDIEFEKAVLVAARNARSEAGFSVLIFEGWLQPIVLKGIAIDDCTVEVTVKEGLQPHGKVLCEKRVNLCITEVD